MTIISLRKQSGAVQFSAKAAPDALQLDIMDVIGADFFGDGITAKNIKNALAEAGDCKSVMVNINSPGGDLFEGVAIYNLLKQCGKPVNVNVVGLAASAASLIAMAGDTCTMQLGTEMMIHEAMAFAAGYADDMRKMANTLDSVTDSAADIYVARTGMSKDKILSLMKAETWMNPEQAKADGFCTACSETKGTMQNSFDLSVFKNAPKELKVEAKVEVPEVTPEPAAAPEAPVVEEEDYKIALFTKRLEILKRK